MNAELLEIEIHPRTRVCRGQGETLSIRMVTTGGAEGETKRKRTASLWRPKRNRETKGEREREGGRRGETRMRETGCPFVVDLFRCRRRRRRGFPFHCTHTPLCFVISPNFLRVRKFENVTLFVSRPLVTYRLFTYATVPKLLAPQDKYHLAANAIHHVFSPKKKKKDERGSVRWKVKCKRYLALR